MDEGTRLVHIGPPKTGTSALQAAFHLHRRETLRQGVRYAGSARHSGAAVLALTGRPSFGRDAGSPPISKWQALLRDVRGAREPRVLVSSEFFADAEPPAIHRAVEDLGRDRLHVVVTLRRLDRIIPSQWQQYVQSFHRGSFDGWLQDTLLNPPGPSPTFWRRHRHDRLVERWAAEVGRERVTVVVIDERDRDHILRVFEGLLGLRSGTLEADDDVVNRSMTWPEIEAVRAFNIAFKEAGLGNALYHRVMHFGAAPAMKTRVPPADEPRIRLPRWAMDASAEVSREMVANLRASGVRVIGALGALVPTPGELSSADHDDGADARRCISPEIAAAMTVAMAIVSGHARGVDGDGAQRAATEAALGRYATYQLAGAVLARLRRRVGLAIEVVTRRGGRHSASAMDLELSFHGAELATARTIEARFEAEGLVSPTSRALLRRGLGFAAEALAAEAFAAEAPPAGTKLRSSECVAPTSAAWFALGMLEAAGVVRTTSARRPGPLRPVLWWWAEPPELARIPTATVAAAALRRLALAARRRLWR